MAFWPDAVAGDENKDGSPRMAAALYYYSDAYTTSSPKLMGRNAAGESFLRGFLTHSCAPSSGRRFNSRRMHNTLPKQFSLLAALTSSPA